MHIIGIVLFAILMAFFIEKWISEKEEQRELRRQMRHPGFWDKDPY
jgi:hypothetical protein